MNWQVNSDHRGLCRKKSHCLKSGYLRGKYIIFPPKYPCTFLTIFFFLYTSPCDLTRFSGDQSLNPGLVGPSIIISPILLLNNMIKKIFIVMLGCDFFEKRKKNCWFLQIWKSKLSIFEIIYSADHWFDFYFIFHLPITSLEMLHGDME